jgi:predicted ester cyclase
MTATNNKEFMRRYFDAFSGKEKTKEKMDRFVADSDPELKQHIVLFEVAFPRYELVVEDLLAEEDKVAARLTMRGTHLGEFMGIQPTGKEVEWPVMLIYQIVDDKVIDHWMIGDQMNLMQQLGVVPEPGTA